MGGEQGAEVECEIEGDGFFVEGGGELGAEVCAAVGCIDDDGEVCVAGWWRWGGNIYTLRGGCDGKNEAGAEGGEA